MGIKRPFMNLIFPIPVLFLVGCAQIKAIIPKDPEPNQISGVLSEVRFMDQMTIVTFQDGRIQAFYGLSVATFQKGKINIIYYDSGPEIVSVKIE
jgi:hypothetical protein